MPHKTEQFPNTASGQVRRWLHEIQLADKSERDWRESSRKIIRKYRDDDRERPNTERRYNILWANTETLKPQLYSRTPEPVVRRRFHDKDPLGRGVAQVLERAAEYAIDAYDFDGTIDNAVFDHLLTGRGIARVRYVPTFEQGEAPMIGVQVSEDDEGFPRFDADFGEGLTQVAPDQVQQGEAGPYVLGEPEEEVVYEEARCEYVNWEDFRVSPARTWPEVRWVAFRHRMTNDELKTAFGANNAAEIPLDFNPNEEPTDDSDEQHVSRRATVWEIWHKENREVIFIAEGMKDRPVEVREDPLNLDGFFPCPEPLYSVPTTNTMVPIPEYTLYQDQAIELNHVTTRIDRLVEALKARGLYAGEHKEELGRLLRGDDNELIPVEDWVGLEGKLEDKIAWMPIEQIAKTLQWLYQQRDQLLTAIYQITGIADIMRGSTDAREGVGTQQLKGQFGVMRLHPRQRRVQKFVRDLIELKIEIMAEMFDPQTLSLMTGTDIPNEAMEFMRNDGLRGFRIDIETDSTIDDQADKREIAEAFNAMSSLAQNLAPLAQSGQIAQPAIKEIFLWGMRRFRVSRQVEDALEADPQPQPERPDPIEMAKVQNDKMARETERLKALSDMQERQSEMQFKMMELTQKRNEAIDKNEQHAIDAAIKLIEQNEQTFREAMSKVGQENQQAGQG